MDLKKFQDFVEYMGVLKHLNRTGWELKIIDHPETVASHSYRMAMLSFLVDTNENLNELKVIQMALIHDLAECIIGDITPHCGVSPKEKHQREDEAMVYLCHLLGNKGPKVLELFREYELRESPEAKYVKNLDRFDLISQAYEYERDKKIPGKLQEFFSNSVDKVSDPSVVKMVDEIMSRRESLLLNSEFVEN